MTCIKGNKTISRTAGCRSYCRRRRCFSLTVYWIFTLLKWCCILHVKSCEILRTNLVFIKILTGTFKCTGFLNIKNLKKTRLLQEKVLMCYLCMYTIHVNPKIEFFCHFLQLFSPALQPSRFGEDSFHHTFLHYCMGEDLIHP